MSSFEATYDLLSSQILLDGIRDNNSIIHVSCFLKKLRTVAILIKEFGQNAYHTRKNGCQFLILNNTGLISKYSNFIQTVLNKMQIKINKLDEGNVVEMSLPHHKVVMTTKDGFKSCWMSYYKKGNEHFILYDDGYNQTCTYSLYKVMKHISNEGVSSKFFRIAVLRYDKNVCDSSPENVENSEFGQFVPYEKYLLTQENTKVYDELWKPFRYLLAVVDGFQGLPENAQFTFDVINKVKEIVNEFQDVFRHLGLCCAKYYCAFYIIYINKILVCQEGVNDRIIMSSLLITLTRLKQAIKDEISSANAKNIGLLNFLSPKCGILLDILLSVRSDESCLVFTDKPITAKCLSRFIQKYFWRNEIKNVESTFLVGSKSDGYTTIKERSLKQDLDQDVIDRFNERKYNILFVSNVQNELLNIKVKCKTIVFDPFKTFDYYFYARSRCSDGAMMKFFIETNNEFESTKQEYIKYSFLYPQYVESYRSRILEPSSDINLILSYREFGDDIFHGSGLEYERDIRNTPAYRSVQARLTSCSNSSTEAWKIIEKYINSLPRSKFVPLSTRKSVIKSESECYTIRFQLPINSRVKTVLSIQEPSRNMGSDLSLVLDVIAKLYDYGELDIDLSPERFNFELAPLKITKNCQTTIRFPNWRVDEEVSNKCKTGSNKRIRLIPIKYPSCFFRCNPKPLELTFVHFIHFEPDFPMENNKKKHLNQLWRRRSGFGIVSSKMLSPVCKFPIYASLGKIVVSVKSNAFTVILKEEDIKKLWKFHLFIVRDVLDIDKCFLKSDGMCENESYILAPVHSVNDTENDMEIDWLAVENANIHVPDHNSSDDIPPVVNVTDEEYLEKLIIPWYRGNSSSLLRYYVVTAICRDLNPESKLSDNYTGTYAEYYKEKYDLNVNNKEQPLLEVHSLSQGLDCIEPRGDTVSQRRKRGQLRVEYDEILIPEICSVQPFPAVYVMKAFVLPTILHQMYYLLLAEELRNEIATSVFPGEQIIYDEFECLPDHEQSTTELSSFGTDNFTTFALESIRKLTSNRRDKNYPLSVDIERIDGSKYVHLYCYWKFIDETYSFLDDSIIDSDDKDVIFVEPPSLDILNEQLAIFKHPSRRELIKVFTTPDRCDLFNQKELSMWGDAYLKYVVSVCLYTMCPKLNSKQLIQLLNVAVGKRNLYYCASRLRLGEYLKMYKFMSDSVWLPPGFDVPKKITDQLLSLQMPPESLYSCNIPLEERLSGEISSDTMANVHEQLVLYLYGSGDEVGEKPSNAMCLLRKQQVSDKTLILVFKSLISLYAKKCGIVNFCKLLQYLGIIQFEETALENVFQKRDERSYDLGLYAIDHFIPRYKDVEKKLGYKFRNNVLLLTALTHPSCHRESIEECYQQLSFLGDSVLDFLLTSYIGQYCADKKSVELLAIRYALTNNITYAHYSVRLDLHKYALFNSPILLEMLMKFANMHCDTDDVFGSESLYLMEESECDVIEKVEVPAFLSDIFKSIIGAIYVDSDKDLKIVWKIVYNIIKNTLAIVCSNVPQDPLLVLMNSNFYHEFGQCEHVDELYVEISLNLTVNRKTSVYRGSGLNKSQAKRAAAKLLLREVEKEQIM